MNRRERKIGKEKVAYYGKGFMFFPSIGRYVLFLNVRGGVCNCQKPCRRDVKLSLTSSYVHPP